MNKIIADNSILSSISPRALKVYNFLKEKANRLTNSSFWRKSKIAAACLISESTVLRAIRELKSSMLIRVEERYERCGRQKSSEYFILNPDAKEYLPPCENVKKLTRSNLKVYAYINKRCACGAYSYSIPMASIAASCGISRVTAHRCVAYLRKNGFIEAKAQTRIAQFGDAGNNYNLYSILKPTTKAINKSKILLKILFAAFIVSSVTLSFLSSVTPHITLFKLNTTNKRKITSVLNKLTDIGKGMHARFKIKLAKFNREKKTAQQGITMHKSYNKIINIFRFLCKLRE